MKNKLNLKKVDSIEELEKLYISFEEVYIYLEQIIAIQESGEASLEDNIAYYKTGKLLSLYAQKMLDKAKLDIENISM